MTLLTLRAELLPHCHYTSYWHSSYFPKFNFVCSGISRRGRGGWYTKKLGGHCRLLGWTTFPLPPKTPALRSTTIIHLHITPLHSNTVVPFTTNQACNPTTPLNTKHWISYHTPLRHSTVRRRKHSPLPLSFLQSSPPTQARPHRAARCTPSTPQVSILQSS